jgi:hypothetical protein
LSDKHTCSWLHGTRYQAWAVPRLWVASSGLLAVEADLFSLEELAHLRPDCPTPKGGRGWLRRLPDWNHPEVLAELPRIERSDLTYPILIHPAGWVMDGLHRLAKSYRKGARSIQAVRFSEADLPLPDIEIPDYYYQTVRTL